MSVFSNLMADVLIKTQKPKVEGFLKELNSIHFKIAKIDQQYLETLLLLKPLVKWIIESESERVIIIDGNPHNYKYLKSEQKILQTVNSLLASGSVKNRESSIKVPEYLLNELRDMPFIDYGDELIIDEYEKKTIEFLKESLKTIVDLFNAEKYEYTIEKLNGCILIHPEFGPFYNLKGRSFMYLKDYENALYNFFLALDYGEDEIEIRKYRLSIFLDLGAKNLAIKDSEKILVKEPDNLDCNTGLGAIYFQVGDYQNSIKYLSIAENLNPSLKTEEEFQILKSEAQNLYRIRKKYPENYNEIHFILILSMASLFATSGNEFAQLLNKKEFIASFSEYAIHLKNSMRVNFENAHIKEVFSYTVDHMKNSDLFLELVKIVRQFPENLRFRFIVDLIRLKRNLLANKNDEILKTLCKGVNIEYQFAENISKQVSHSEYFIQVAKAVQENNFSKAKELFKKIIELWPDFYYAYVNLARIYSDEGNYNESISCYLEGLKLNYEISDFFHNSLGWERVIVGAMDQAYLNFKISLLINPENYYALTNLGGVKLVLGDPKVAINLLSTVLEKSDDNELTAEALYYRGLAYSSLGNIEKSKSDLDEALKLDFNPKDNPIANRVRKDSTGILSQSHISKNESQIDFANNIQKREGLQTKSHCTQCGKELDNQDKFCSGCGAKVMSKDESIRENNSKSSLKSDSASVNSDKEFRINKFLGLAINEQLNRNINGAVNYLNEAVKLGSEEAKRRLIMLKKS